jgi:hypothetical protein
VAARAGESPRVAEFDFERPESLTAIAKPLIGTAARLLKSQSLGAVDRG